MESAKQYGNATVLCMLNHFVPRPVELIVVRQNVNSVRPKVNTGRANVLISADHPLKNIEDRGLGGLVCGMRMGYCVCYYLNEDVYASGVVWNCESLELGFIEAAVLRRASYRCGSRILVLRGFRGGTIKKGFMRALKDVCQVEVEAMQEELVKFRLLESCFDCKRFSGTRSQTGNERRGYLTYDEVFALVGASLEAIRREEEKKEEEGKKEKEKVRRKKEETKETEEKKERRERRKKKEKEEERKEKKKERREEMKGRRKRRKKRIRREEEKKKRRGNNKKIKEKERKERRKEEEERKEEGRKKERKKKQRKKEKEGREKKEDKNRKRKKTKGRRKR
ncbi:hypothetical protein Tco_0703927 [Tanacetum coccineum]|uniref:Uncharacterized protein n=1 Tax=Tanacetum coccineum TaxID=301880 RepID=A0ABQ4Y1Q8_9ASTR